MARVLNRDGSPASDIVALASSGEDERLPKASATGSSSWTVVWSTGHSIEACSVDATGKADDFRAVTSGSSRPVDQPDISRLLFQWQFPGRLGRAGCDRTERDQRAQDPHGRRNGREGIPPGDAHPITIFAIQSIDQAGIVRSSSGRSTSTSVASTSRGGSFRPPPNRQKNSVDVISIAADGVQNTCPSVAAFPGTGAFFVVWQRSEGRRDSDIAFANVTGQGIQSSGKLTDTGDFRETRPFASGVGLAGRVLVTYQTAPSDSPRTREVAARTMGWGDPSASAEIALDSERSGGGNPASVRAAGAAGRGLVVWDVKEGEGTSLFAKEWLALELAADPAIKVDGPILPLADVVISGAVTMNGMGQADVLMSGFPVTTRTDATGAYSGSVPIGWSGTVIPVQPGFTFSPSSRPYTNQATNATGQNYAAAFAGGVDDIYEENDSFATAASLPLGTTHDLVLRDEDWFKVLVPAEDAGKDLKIRLWATGFPDTTTRRDLDFGILDASGKVVSFSVSSNSDETAIVCNVAAGYYYIVQDYIELEGTVYSITAELSNTFGLSYVTGHVTDDQGTPIEGATVELYGVPFDYHVTRPLVFTDAAGYYRIGYVPGEFQILFNTFDFNDNLDWTPDANYLGEMYNYGEVVVLPAAGTVENIDGVLTPGGVITGRITDGSGSPLLNALAYAYSSDVGNNGSAYTDANGDYSIDRLRAGNFAVRMRTPGGVPMINEWYNDQAIFASAGPVGVEAGVTTQNVNAMLEAKMWGTIVGRVLDGNGNPVGNLQVAVVDPVGISLWTTRTDGMGYYTLSGVPAGAWKVFFNAKTITSANLVSQYYPGTRFIGEAGTVQVSAGQLTQGIGASLSFAGTISGQVLNDAGPVNIIAFDMLSSYFQSVSVALPLTGPGTYTISNLPPGSYKVLARPSQQGDRIAHWYPDAASSAGAGTVTVVAGGTTADINVTLPGGGGLIHGRVLDTDGFPIAGVNVIAQDASRVQSYSSAMTDIDGNYTIRQVPPGSAKVYFSTDGMWLGYASEYYNNQPGHSAANTVTVTDGTTTTLLDAALAYRPALAVATSSLPAGEVAVAYQQQLAAAGGRPFYRWSITGGILPDGLTMSSNGLITGVPTTTGTFPFTVTVYDSTMPPSFGEIQYLSITVGTYAGEGYTITGTVTSGGSPLAGVVMNGFPGDPITSSAGTYVAVVEPGWWNTVTPVLAGYAFDPPLKTYMVVAGNLSGQDYAASPGHLLSGTVRLNGVGQGGVLMAGLPLELRTNTDGSYAMMLPTEWSQTVTPTLPGFSFSPPNRSYNDGMGSDKLAQDYTSTYAGGADDSYEENDSFAAAAVVPMGTVVPDLVLNDEDWFKFFVPAEDAGKTLGVRLTATSFPNGTAQADPANFKDLDYGIMDATGRLLTYSMSGDVDEVAFIPDVASGWYYIAHTYIANPGMVYSLFVTTSNVLPVGTISGKVTDNADQGIGGVPVELYGLPFDWNKNRPMAITDDNGNYKIAFFAGDYQVQFNLQDFDQNPNDGLPDSWLVSRNFQPKSYDFDKTVTIVPGTPITGADVVLDPGGTVSGRITDAGGNPLHQAIAAAYAANGSQASYAYTDANGNYTINRLRTANYAVSFRPPSGNSLGREWFNDRASFGESRPVAVIAGATTAGIDAALAEGAYVSGIVTDSLANPIQGVQVTAFDVSGIALQSVNTQPDGSYLINRIPGGSVKILFNAGPCYSGNYISEYYPDKGTLAEAQPVAVTLGQTTSGIDAVLSPAGAIAGRLTDNDGHGLLSGFVQCFENVSGAYGGAQPDADGNFLVRNLPAGNYRVRFSFTYNWITNFPAELFDDKPSFGLGDLVPVSAGGTTNGINAVLEHNGGGISGRVTDSIGTGIAGLTVVVSDANGNVANSTAVTDANGYYTVLNVPVGPAKVYFNADSISSRFASEFYNDKGDHGTADPVMVTQGVTAPNIDAVLAERPGLTATTASLPNGELGVDYNQTLAASGGRTFYYWTIIGGALPDGLTMGPGGRIKGLPTMAGTFVFTVQVTDSTKPQQIATRELSITVGPHTGVGYVISGKILFGETPLSGVVMYGLPGAPLTNGAGGYAWVAPEGWSGTVRPSLPGYIFAPEVRTYSNLSADQAGQDYAASVGFIISGTVTLGGAGLGGVTMSGLPGNPLTDATGLYIGGVPTGWSGTVTPTLQGHIFTPTSKPYSNVTTALMSEDYTALALPGKLRLFVKSTVDTGIWMNPMASNETFDGWELMPGGTSTTPTVGVFNNRLHLVVKDTVDDKMWYRSMDATSTWGDWSQLSGFSPSTASMAAFNNKLYLVVRGSNDLIYYRGMDTGGVWGDWGLMPGATTTPPVVAVFNGKLHLVVKSSVNMDIWWNSMDATETWSGWQKLSGLTPGPVAMAEYNNRLYMFVRGSDDRIYYRSMDTEGTWGDWTGMYGWTTISPTVGSFNGKLYLFVKASVGDSIYMRSMDAEETWGGWSMISGATTIPMVVAIF